MGLHVGDMRDAVRVAGTVRLMTSSGLHGTGRHTRMYHPCFARLRRALGRVTERGASFSSICTGRSLGGGAYCMIVTNSEKLTNNCGAGLFGYLRTSTRNGSCVILPIKGGTIRCFHREKVRTLARRFTRTKDVSMTSYFRVTGVLYARFHGKAFNRVRLYCAIFGSVLSRRPRMFSVLPVASVERRDNNGVRAGGLVLCRPSKRAMFSTVIPRCLTNLICNNVYRDATDRLTTEHVTVSTTADGTRRVVSRLGLCCGETHRTDVARRVARVITNTRNL